MAKKTEEEPDGVSEIRRMFGQGAISCLGAEGALVPAQTVSTGAIGFDRALGCGGLPYGRMVEVYGPEGGGKSTLSHTVIRNAQKDGHLCAYVDSEHAMDPVYVQQIGVDLNRLYISQPDYGEQALETADILVKSSDFDVVIVDSVAALVPKAELEGQMGDVTVGLQARMMSQAMRKLGPGVRQSNTLLIFTNQVREKIGVVYGSPETQPGGRALKFYASQRIDLRRISTLKEGSESVGIRVRARVVKNRLAAPYRTAEFDIDFGKGISASGSLLDLGVEIGLIKQSGSYFAYEGERLGQGRANVKKRLDEDGDLALKLDGALRDSVGIRSSLQAVA